MKTKRRRGAALVVPLTAIAAIGLGLAAPAQAAPTHVDNPFSGATWYVNDKWASQVESAASRAGGTLGAQMMAVAEQPTFVWMDRIGAIGGNVDGPGLRYHLDAALEQQQGDTPIVFGLVIYNLPGRDCFALASNGELPATPEGAARYQAEYIDPIAEMLAEPQYEDIRVAAVIEPDSLPNLVTNISDAKCATAAPYYRNGVKYALDELHAIPNVYTYVDAAHSGWLGWDSNLGPSITLFAEVARSTNAGFASIDGFVTNTANTTPLVEPYLPDSGLTVGGNPLRSSAYYQWNPYFDEADFTAAFRQQAIAAGFPSTLGMLVDTSRNGWGGPDRPTAVSTSTNLDTYVNASRIDRRTHRGAWCNPLGAGLGERPKATPSGYSQLDAFVWVKPPGESDGSSSEIPNDEGKGFDRMCDPTFASPKLDGALTGATPDAPVSGKWFEAQFATLVANAYPAVTPGDVPDDDTQAPTAPGAPTVSNITATSATLTWAASSDNVGVTGYTVRNATTGATLATSTGRTATLTGLTASTTYNVSVVARDAAGNVSSASPAVTFVTTGGGTTDTQAPTAPGPAIASGITTTSATLTWTASTDNVGVTGYTVQNAVTGATLATSTTTSATVSGLTADTAYTVRVVARDAAGNVSPASSSSTFRTTAGSTTDTQAPTAPGTPVASSITETSATLTWTASTDNVGVTGYTVQNAAGATLATSTTTSATLTGLTANTSYTVRVVARDAAGNVSPASSSTTFRTTGGTVPGSCTAALTVLNSWPGGYQAEVKVTAGSAAISSWTTSFTLSGSSTNNLWSGRLTGSTGAITVSNLEWNGSLGAGQSTAYGFIGNGTPPGAVAVTCS